MKMFIGLMLLSSLAIACDKDCSEYNGICACEQKPQMLTRAEETQPSDEKPPRDKMPSYQREGIHAEMPLSTAGQDVLRDEAVKQADAEGKKSAGIQ